MGRRFVTSAYSMPAVALDDHPLLAGDLDAHGVAEDATAVLVFVHPDADVLAGVVRVPDPAAATTATATHVRTPKTVKLP